MIRLDSHLQKLQAFLNVAVTTSQPTSVVCYTDKENEAQKKFFIESVTCSLNSTTPVDICPAPDKAVVREIDSVHIRNNDTADGTITVRISNNGTSYELIKVIVKSGETLVYTRSEGWKVITQYGNVSAVFGYIDFSADTYPSAAQRIKWNDTDGTLDVGLKGGVVNLSVGLGQLALAKEASNGGITKGKAYYFSSSNGSNKLVAKAIASNMAQTELIIGVAAESSSGGTKAFICTFGLVRDIDTNHLTEGGLVYLSAATAGDLTATMPSAPNFVARIGYCIRKSATVGAIFVDVNAGTHLEYLHDVKLSSLADKQYLRYNGTSTLWENTSGGEFSTLKVDGALEIKDGMTAPTATANIAKIYVDSADGDLKVIFADGTVKTIVTDT